MVPSTSMFVLEQISKSSIEFSNSAECISAKSCLWSDLIPNVLFVKNYQPPPFPEGDNNREEKQKYVQVQGYSMWYAQPIPGVWNALRLRLSSRARCLIQACAPMVKSNMLTCHRLCTFQPLDSPVVSMCQVCPPAPAQTAARAVIIMNLNSIRRYATHVLGLKKQLLAGMHMFFTSPLGSTCRGQLVVDGHSRRIYYGRLSVFALLMHSLLRIVSSFCIISCVCSLREGADNGFQHHSALCLFFP